MTEQEQYIARLKAMMADKGWKPKDIAELTGKSIQTIYSVLCGGNKFPTYLLLALEIHETSKHRLQGWQKESRLFADSATGKILEKVYNLLILKP